MKRELQLGDYIKWENLRGDKFEGTIIEWDSNMAIVKSPDGRILTCDNAR